MAGNAGVFNTNQQYAKSFAARDVQVQFRDSLDGFIAQSIQLGYQQNISLIYELGSPKVYYAGGRATGTAQLARVVGGTSTNTLISQFEDICNPGNILINYGTGCSTSTGPSNQKTGVTYKLQGAVMTGLNGTVQAQDVIFNEQLAYMFLNLNVADGNGQLANGNLGINTTGTAIGNNIGNTV